MTNSGGETRALAIRLSNRQYGQLKYLANAPNGTLNIQQVSQMNQTTLGGNKRRGFVTETAGHDGVMLTGDGRRALHEFEHGDFTRRVASMHFSSFLSLENWEQGERRRERPVAAKKAVKKVVKKGAGSVVRAAGSRYDSGQAMTM